MSSTFVIYKIYWPGKKFYYGRTMGFRKRRNRHLREMLDGSHHNRKLVHYAKLWGLPKIKIVAYAGSIAELTLLEKNILKFYGGHKNCCNLSKC